MNARFDNAIQRFDHANAQDPNQEVVNGQTIPKELLYAQRLTEWVLRLDPQASEALRLAARCQHICRWKIPRASYPLDRPGYLKWRNALKQFHAEEAGRILRECGYGEEMVRRVQELNLKKNLPSDPESRTLEDALCLVFLQYQFGDLAAKTERGKMVNALRKSWGKMSETGRAAALGVSYPEAEQALLREALAGPKTP